MALFDSYKSAGVIAQELADVAFLSVNVQTPDDVQTISGGVLSLPTSGGILSRIMLENTVLFNGVLSEAVGKSIQGNAHFVKADSYFLDGTTLDLGVISESITIGDIGLWNAFGASIEVDAITIAPSTGISVTYPEPGDVIQSQDEVPMVLVISIGAPPIIDSLITVSFVGGYEISFSISGRIGTLLDLPPQSKTTESITFKTDIITSRNGLEQRIGVRSAPRQSFAVGYEFSPERGAMRIRNKLEGSAGRIYTFPIWTEQRSGDAITAGDIVLVVDTDYADFRDGGNAFIYQEGVGSEPVQIASVASGSLTLSDPIVGSYNNPVITPLMNAYGNIDASGNLTSNGSIEYNINLRVFDNTNITPATFATTYGGFPVVTDGGWFAGRSQGRTIASGAWTLDNQTGRFLNLSKWNVPKNAFEYGYYMETPEQVWDFRRFVHYLNGMQKAIWIPTLDNDFVLSRSIGATDTIIYLENTKYSESWGEREFSDHVAIFDGTTWYFREISESSEIDSSEETITLASSLGSGYSIGDVKVMRMPLCRLMSDKVDVKWIRAGQAESSISFIEVER